MYLLSMSCSSTSINAHGVFLLFLNRWICCVLNRCKSYNGLCHVKRCCC
jgi:hypothetical protein